ncbi:hypothetical protein BGW36DRAFT_373766 [Talaromyces proteolyticus]|uniref:Uncharacterized protein n=1 Tax=Talaromyces proteolyticus TaxID=1131652 RepID=A0AAD4KST8_9EURO|nr:uncharacterized protein BGW36DRAFT_373766 [Talaromyces proteolyticus]KAH8700272.1 hypothetical protein BGW36DRAFT_373766 [Talaromyces proteolyticus]
MPPITKLWHCRLREGCTADSPAFLQVLSEIFELCSSYTNPDPASPPMHIMYQDINDPAKLLMITGYQSQELNTEADKAYASNYLPRMFEHVQHGWLKQLDADIASFSLEESLTVTYGLAPETWKLEQGAGGWDVWPQTAQARKNINQVQDLKEGLVWVQITPGSDGAAPKEGGKLQLRKVLGR